MALTKAAAKAHRQACELVNLARDLTKDEREFVLDHWQESEAATHNLDGAYFTPGALASEFTIDVGGKRILDLCAGIGRLSYHARQAAYYERSVREVTCVERNPEYVRVGRRILPEARWIQADVFDLPADLGQFDTAISNPPFGATARPRASGLYTGRRFEYHVLALASQLAEHGVFIVPQESAPFVYSGRAERRWRSTREYERFSRETGIELEFNVGVDTADYAEGWHGIRPPVVEIVTSDFTETRARRSAPAPAPHREEVRATAQSALW